jgi:hypothetical protein
LVDDLRFPPPPAPSRTVKLAGKKTCGCERKSLIIVVDVYREKG